MHSSRFRILLGLFVFNLLVLPFKSSFFQILILFEVSLILTAVILLLRGLSPWFILPLFGIGACERAAGLSVAVWFSRTQCVSAISL